MATDRKAEVTWRGDLLSGGGRVESVTSRALGGLDVSWPARTEEPSGLTSPEELIAAAHATCFSMAFSSGLAKEGHAPEELKTSATVTFQPGESREWTKTLSSRQRSRRRRTVRSRKHSPASRKSA